MTRLMYDSTSASAIPLDAVMVAGYCDGWYRWSAADWARFPNAIHVPIACFPTTNAGTVLDVESGCSLPADAPSWTLRRRAAGVDPTVYVNRSNWGLTRQAFIQQGVPEPHYWLAAYDNIAEIPAGTVAKQYADSAMAGGHYDLSAVADHWPGVDPSNPNATAGSEVIAGGTMTPDQEAKLLRDVAWLVATMSQMYHAGAAPNDWPNWTALVAKVDALKSAPSGNFPPLNITLTGTAKVP